MIDAHCHIQDEALAPFLADVLARARSAGVAAMICNGTGPADWRRLREMAAADASVWPCYGVHPWFVDHCGDGWFEQLEEVFRHEAAAGAAVGEIGLDRYVEPRDEARQEAVFRRQLALACRLDRPAMLHVVRAWPWLTAVLSDGPRPAKFLLHAFAGPAEVVATLAKRGAYFSVGPAGVSPDCRERSRRALSAVPLERLVIETDAPDFHPRDLPPRLRDEAGKPLNEPANLPHVLAGLANILEMPASELAEITTRNAKQLWE